MLVTFKKKWYCALLQGKKKQTVRYNFYYWLKKVTKNGYPGWDMKKLLDHLHKYPHVSFRNHSDERLHIWMGNPRNIHLKPRKLGFSKANWTVKFVRGYQFTHNDALMDGFKDRDQMINALAEINDIFPSDVASDVWAIISWEWDNGPHSYH